MTTESPRIASPYCDWCHGSGLQLVCVHGDWGVRKCACGGLPPIGNRRLPLASELTGSNPDITGELSTEEYIRRIRHGGLPPVSVERKCDSTAGETRKAMVAV